MVLGVRENDVECSVGDVTRLVLLYGGSETFPGSRLGFKVMFEVEKPVGVEVTVIAKEVCDWTEELMVPGTGAISEVDVILTVVSEMVAVVLLLS